MLAVILKDMKRTEQQSECDFFAQVSGAYVDGIRAGLLFEAKPLLEEPTSTFQARQVPPIAALSYAAVARQEGQNWNLIP